MCVETLRTGLCFSETINLRGYMPRFILKMNHCRSLVSPLETPVHVVCRTLRTGIAFHQTILLDCHHV